MKKLTYKMKSLLMSLAILSLLTTFYACDMLESDVKPEGPSFELVNGEIHVLTDGKGYIDLYSIVKTKSKIKLNVASQPTNGELQEVGTGLLKYIPFKEFKGKDAFRFSIYDGNNKLLQTDTIDIIVVDDPSNLPCIYPKDDWIYAAGIPPLTVDVVGNDVICGNTSDLVVEIYRPNNSFPPHVGSASVNSQNQIVWDTPNWNQYIQDSVVYKVYKASNPSVVGFATLAIDFSPATCIPVINRDDYIHQVGSPRLDTLDLNVMLNDWLCGATPETVELSVTELPKHSNIIIEGDIIRYPYELTGSNPTIDDSLTYRVCIDQQCYTSQVTVKLF